MGNTEDYLALAKSADESAATAQSPIARRTWKNLAEEYRKIAALKLERFQPRRAPKRSFRRRPN